MAQDLAPTHSLKQSREVLGIEKFECLGEEVEVIEEDGVYFLNDGEKGSE